MLGLGVISAASLAAVASNPVERKILIPAAAQLTPVPAAPPSVRAPVYSVSSPIVSDIARWNALRQSDNLPFSSYSSFLLGHRGWPGETAMRRSAENAIDPNSVPASDVIAYFRVYPPLSAAGHAKHGFALLAAGRIDEAREAARTAWRSGTMPKPDEDRLLGLFGSYLTPNDHDLRTAILLANGDIQGARRSIAFTSAAQRPIFEARLSLQTRAPDAASRLAMIGSIGGDPGLLMDRANWLRNTGQSMAARQLLAQRPPLTGNLPANPETWFETLLVIGRAAANDSQWTMAYQISSQFDDAYPAGSDISVRPYGERDNYTSLAWLAGTIALNQLRRPEDATRMFERYALAARSPQTRSKGFYWAARAARLAGQDAQAAAFLEQAAASPDQFYGQLALERLGREILPPSDPPTPGQAERAAFGARPLVGATRMLGQMGQWTDQTMFVRALAQQLENDSDRVLANEFGRQIGRPDLGVWIAREARAKGSNFYSRAGFPDVPVPPAYSRHWTLGHAIMRQESSFDRAAVSHAGARGMMQLMPGTAREISRKLGVEYDFGRLTSDPSYNIMLGSSYFSTLLDEWGGNAPLAVASYNAGSGNVRKWVRENGDPRLPGADIVRWIEQIPYLETRNYVQRVLENAVVYDAINPQRRIGPGNNRLSYYLGKRDPG